jgi:hypothetical protein
MTETKAVMLGNVNKSFKKVPHAPNRCGSMRQFALVGAKCVFPFALL